MPFCFPRLTTWEVSLRSTILLQHPPSFIRSFEDLVDDLEMFHLCRSVDNEAHDSEEEVSDAYSTGSDSSSDES